MSSINEVNTATAVPVPTLDDELPWAWLKAANEVLSNPPFSPQERQVVKPEANGDPGDPAKAMTMMLPWVYLSSWYGVWDSLLLQQQRQQMRSEGDNNDNNDIIITHVLSANEMSEEELKPIRELLQTMGIKHHHVSGKDEHGYDMMGKHWDECSKFLQTARDEKNGKVLVHCQGGVNRSGLMVAAAVLLMSSPSSTSVGNDSNGSNDDKNENNNKTEWTLMDVIHYLKRKRGMILTNISFQWQLCQLAAKYNKLGMKPNGYTDTPVDIP